MTAPSSRGLSIAGLVAGIALLATGCATPPVATARANFYSGRLDAADALLENLPEASRNSVLHLLERGMIRLERGDYEASARDFREAAEREKPLETYSVSRGAASLLVNDEQLAFRGDPYELTLMYAFLATDYLALADWPYAGIAARNIIARLENRDGYPDNAYGRYMAGLCLELLGDRGNAAGQYRRAAELRPDAGVDPDSGAIGAAASGAPRNGHELVCFISLGRAETYSWSGRYGYRAAAYADIYDGEQHLGRSSLFADTGELEAATRKREALGQTVKDAARIAVKEAVAQQVEHENEALGELVRIALYSLEQPDLRRWATLPRLLHIARVPCPSDLASYTVVFRDANGRPTLTRTISSPLVRRGRIAVSYCRDIRRGPSE